MADPERAQLVDFQEALEETHHRDGAGPAMRMFITALPVSPQNRKEGLELPSRMSTMPQNLEAFLTDDAAVRTYRVESPAASRQEVSTN